MEAKAILGIDISKAPLDVSLLREQQGEQAVFDNTATGFLQLKRWLHKRKVTTTHACMEATGRYWEEVAWFLHEGGHTVSVVNPAQVSAFAASHLSRNKTGRADAQLIALFCRSHQPPAWSPPSPSLRALQAMTRHLESLLTMRQQERNRLATQPHTPAVVAALEAHIYFLDNQIDALTVQIKGHLEQHPELHQQRDLLLSIPGIGDVPAAKLLAEIGHITLFAGAPQLAAYAGVTPRQRFSGSSVRGRSRLCKPGNGVLRKALYFPAIVAQQHNPIIRAFCERLRARGKRKMEIVGAAMRKLLHLVYGVLKSGSPFDPAYGAAPQIAS